MEEAEKGTEAAAATRESTCSGPACPAQAGAPPSIAPRRVGAAARLSAPGLGQVHGRRAPLRGSGRPPPQRRRESPAP